MRLTGISLMASLLPQSFSAKLAEQEFDPTMNNDKIKIKGTSKSLRQLQRVAGSILAVGISGLSQSLASNRDNLRNRVFAYVAELVDLIYDHGGDIITLVGDVFICFFGREIGVQGAIGGGEGGSPLFLSDCILRAIQCAFKLSAFETLRSEGQTVVSLHFGIGVSDSLVSVGLGRRGSTLQHALVGPGFDQLPSCLDGSVFAEVIISPQAREVCGEWIEFEQKNGNFHVKALLKSIEPVVITAAKNIDMIASERDVSPESLLLRLEPKFRMYTGHTLQRLLDSKYEEDAGASQTSEDTLKPSFSDRMVTVVFIDIHDLKGDFPEVKAFDKPLATIQRISKTRDAHLQRVMIDERGASLLVVFGLSVIRPDDPTRGCLAAEEFRAALRLQGLAASIAVASGTVCCGFVGTLRRAIYTISGDAIELAEGMARVARQVLPNPNEGGIVVYSSTFEQAQSVFVFDEPPPPPLEIPGRSGRIDVHLPLHRKHVGHHQKSYSSSSIGNHPPTVPEPLAVSEQGRKSSDSRHHKKEHRRPHAKKTSRPLQKGTEPTADHQGPPPIVTNATSSTSRKSIAETSRSFRGMSLSDKKVLREVAQFQQEAAEREQRHEHARTVFVAEREQQRHARAAAKLKRSHSSLT